MSGYFRLRSCAAGNKRATKQSREAPSSHFSLLKLASSPTFQPASAETVTYLLSLSTAVSTDGTGVRRHEGFLKLLRTIALFVQRLWQKCEGPYFQIYSTCWPGVSTRPHKMAICTLAFLWKWLPWTKKKEKKNPVCTTVRSTGNEIHQHLECHLCKQSKACVKLKPSTRPAYKNAKKRRSSLQKKEKKHKKRKKTDTALSLKPLRNSPGFLITEQTSLYKRDGTASAGI